MNDWFQIPAQYPQFQHETWRNGATGKVLVVEEYHDGSGETRYSVMVFDGSYPAPDLPDKKLADKVRSIHDAARTAREYRQQEADS